MENYTIRSLFMAGVLLLVSAGIALGQGAPERVLAKYKTISSMRADYTQTLLHKESGSKEIRSGVLSFVKPLLVRMESKKPSDELLLVTKDAIWNVFPEEEIAYKYSLALTQSSGSIVQVITGQASLDKDFFLDNSREENGLLVLELFPKEPSQSMVELRLWIDPKTDLIKKVRVYDFYGNENELSFSRQETNVSLTPSLFSYTPPKGFAVEDRSGDPNAAPGIR